MADSFQNPGTNCPVPLTGGGDYVAVDDWCACMFGKDSPYYVPCCWGSWCSFLGGYPAAYQHHCAPFSCLECLASPPWTDLGASARGIPKPGAGILKSVFDVANFILPPVMSADDLQPHHIFKLMLMDPIKFARVSVFYAPFAAAGSFPPTAIASAAIAGGSAMQDYIIDPVLDFAPDMINAVVTAFVTGGFFAAGVELSCKRIAKSIVVTTWLDAVAKFLFTFIGANAVQIMTWVKNGINSFGMSSMWLGLGQIIKQAVVGSGIETMLPALGFIQVLADGFITFSESIACICRGDIPGAIDNSTVSANLFGMKLSDLKALIGRVGVAGLSLTQPKIDLLNNFGGPGGTLDKFSGAIGKVAQEVGELLSFFNVLAKALVNLTSTIHDVLGLINGVPLPNGPTVQAIPPPYVAPPVTHPVLPLPAVKKPISPWYWAAGAYLLTS